MITSKIWNAAVMADYSSCQVPILKVGKRGTKEFSPLASPLHGHAVVSNPMPSKSNVWNAPYFIWPYHPLSSVEPWASRDVFIVGFKFLLL
jgi:hypothetical protein